MINLLPPRYKQKFRQEENLKIVLILGILAMFFLFCLCLLLLSMKIYISGEAKANEILFQQSKKEFESSEIQNFKKEIDAVNQDLARLDLFYQNQTRFTPFIKKISETLPPDIHLTNLSFTTADGEERGFQVFLSGFALERESLFQFKKNLQTQENFEEICIPLDSWVKPANINFSLNFKITCLFNKK
jgi:Tfp pilus assembly protein PilN